MVYKNINGSHGQYLTILIVNSREWPCSVEKVKRLDSENDHRVTGQEQHISA